MQTADCGGNSWRNSGIPDSIKLISSFILLSLAVAVQTLSHVTDLTASESREDTADMMILFSMPVTSDSESEVCMPDKNDVAGSNDIVSFLMTAMSSERNNFFRVPSWVT